MNLIVQKKILENLLENLPNLHWQERLVFLKEFRDIKSIFSTSFSHEDQVITHLIVTKNLPISVCTIDTGRLFEETYKTFQLTIEAYPNLVIETYIPNADLVQELVRNNGINGFYKSTENRLTCCNIRKVKPLEDALKTSEIWISGLRRNQSSNRKDFPIVEYDNNLNIIKLYPLIDVSLQEVTRYIDLHNIPYNPLHDKGFVSIGCAPCTRAVKNGEDSRSGRWWWESNQEQECGLHLQNGKLVRKKIL